MSVCVVAGILSGLKDNSTNSDVDNENMNDTETPLENSTNNVSTSTFDLLANEPDLSTFHQAFVVANYIDILDQSQQLTLFALTNEAFKDAEQYNLLRFFCLNGESIYKDYWIFI